MQLFKNLMRYWPFIFTLTISLLLSCSKEKEPICHEEICEYIYNENDSLIQEEIARLTSDLLPKPSDDDTSRLLSIKVFLMRSNFIVPLLVESTINGILTIMQLGSHLIIDRSKRLRIILNIGLVKEHIKRVL